MFGFTKREIKQILAYAAVCAFTGGCLWLALCAANLG